jgi:eukaryotic-like serine/threonine-protein kinase
MEHLEGKNIKKCLSEIPADNIATLIGQLAMAARFLEELGFVHRDIKPENIILLDDFNRLVLLDLGVVRPLAGSTLTDSEGIQVFVGTLQYSSPEFLLRQEKYSIDGWRALTFYQIGGVLHDLIMRKPLFADFTQPYARLVNAVQHEAPEIQNSAIPYYLVELARCCLLKNWKMRLKFVNWETFNEPEKEEASANSFKQRVTNRGELTRAQAAELSTPVQENAGVARRKLQWEALDYMKAAARTIRAQNAVLPPLQILPSTPNENSFGIQFGISPSSGLPDQLTILIEVTIIEVSARLIQLSACGWLSPFEKAAPGGATFQLVFQGTYDAPAKTSQNVCRQTE